MGERITEKPVMDRSKYPGAMIYVDKEGYVCKADKPKPISEEEKAKRKKVRDDKRKVVMDARAKARKEMQEAKKAARQHALSNDAEKYRQKYVDSVAKYEEVMGN